MTSEARRRCTSTSSRLKAPKPPRAASTRPRRARGEAIFDGQGEVRELPRRRRPSPSRAGNMHTAAEIGTDSFQADRSPDAPTGPRRCKGLFAHAKGGFYHDGRFATLGTWSPTTTAAWPRADRRAEEPTWSSTSSRCEGGAMRGPSLRTLSLASAAALAAAYALVFLSAPFDADQGLIQKIFYIHVPLAIVCLCGFVAGAVAGFRSAHRRPGWDLRSYVFIHLSLIFAVGVLVTGSIWARGSWGHWWVWERADAGLAADRLPPLLHLPAAALRDRGPGRQARYAAVFAVVAGAFVPLNFLAVRLAQPLTHPRVLSATRRPHARLDAARVPRRARRGRARVRDALAPGDRPPSRPRSSCGGCGAAWRRRSTTPPPGRPSATSRRWPDADRAGGASTWRRRTSVAGALLVAYLGIMAAKVTRCARRSRRSASCSRRASGDASGPAARGARALAPHRAGRAAGEGGAPARRRARRCSTRSPPRPA